MQGIKLSSMEASDMLDVIHALFEEFNSFTSEEDMDSILVVRTSLYEELYGQVFKYKPKKQKGKHSPAPGNRSYAPPTQDLDFSVPADEDGISPFNPREREPTKPYIPPTQFNPDDAQPFGSILDAPLG